MEMQRPRTLEDVKAVIVKTLGIEDRADGADRRRRPVRRHARARLDGRGRGRSPSLEERFGVEIDDEEFSGEVFETIGSLAEFVEEHRTD